MMNIFDVTPGDRAAVDQDMAEIDASIDGMLGALRKRAQAISAEPGLAVAMIVSQMDGLPLFQTKALAARLLVRLLQAEVER
jgi:hypothetical protein